MKETTEDKLVQKITRFETFRSKEELEALIGLVEFAYSVSVDKRIKTYKLLNLLNNWPKNRTEIGPVALMEVKTELDDWTVYDQYMMSMVCV